MRKTVSAAQQEDFDRHALGAIGGDAVWDAVNGFEALYDAEELCPPDIDGLVLVNKVPLIPRADLIVLLGIAALKELESKPGVIVQ